MSSPDQVHSTDQTSLDQTEEQLSPRQIFGEVYSLYTQLDARGGVSSDDRQSKMIRAIRLSNRLVDQMIPQMDIFGSRNEHYEEIAPGDLQMLLVYAMLGHFIQSKRCAYGKHDQRCEIVEEALSRYGTFLEKCLSLSLYETERTPLSAEDLESLLAKCRDRNWSPRLPDTLPDGRRSRQFDVLCAAKTRQEKIERFRRFKMLGAKIQEMRKAIEEANNEGGVARDDERAKEMCIALIQYWMIKAKEDVDCLVEERRLLKSRCQAVEEASSPQSDPPGPGQVPSSAFTLIASRQEEKAFVLGAGYPSLPTMSIEQFYDSLKQRGILQSCHRLDGPNVPLLTDEQVAEQKDEAQDRDQDDQATEEQRNFDDWKDSHFKGEGNRHNRS